jgi:putative FmdB family regulatory protein
MQRNEFRVLDSSYCPLPNAYCLLPTAMPTYDYVCDACEHRFELFQSITAKAKRKCPACGRLKLRRLIGPGAAIVFKGSGFYKTDYRSESYKKGAAAEGAAQGSAGSNGAKDAKSGKKPETAAGKKP